MKKNENIQKTVRFPCQIVEYIELQEGRDFSKKLVNIVEEYRAGESTRCANIARYDKLIEQRRIELDGLMQRMHRAMFVNKKLEKFCEEINVLIAADGVSLISRSDMSETEADGAKRR